MFFDNSLKNQLRWGILLAFICLGFLISTIFFSVYYINYFNEFKEEFIEEKNELILFGLEREQGKESPILHEELTEIYAIHHISARAFSKKNHRHVLFKTGLFINYDIPISISTTPTYYTITYNDMNYIRYIYPFHREDGLYYLEFLAPKPPLSDILKPLFWPFLITFFIFILIIFPLSFWFSNKIIYPIQIIKEQLNSLHSSNLDTPLLPYKNRDEIYDLIESIEKVKHRFHAIFQSLSAYSTLLSHEIRNHLVILQTRIDNYVTSPDKKEELHDIIHTTSDCIDTLKCIYLIDDQRYPYEYSVFKLSFILQQVLSQFKERDRIQMEHIPPFSLETDMLLLQYILKNCIENMLKHSQETCIITLNKDTLCFKNTCSHAQFQRLKTHISQAKESNTIPRASLGILIIVKLTSALTITYDVSFDEKSSQLTQWLNLASLKQNSD